MRIPHPLVKLRELREAQGLSQAELARRAGIRRVTIVEMEAGRTRRVRLDVPEKLAKVLHVPPGALLAAAAPKRRAGAR